MMNAMKIELNLRLCFDNFLENHAVMGIAKYARQRMIVNRKKPITECSFTGEQTKLYIQRRNYNWKLIVVHLYGTAQGEN
jgi:hypothetical protein